MPKTNNTSISTGSGGPESSAGPIEPDDIPFTPQGDIQSTNLESAVVELDSELTAVENAADMALALFRNALV